MHLGRTSNNIHLPGLGRRKHVTFTYSLSSQQRRHFLFFTQLGVKIDIKLLLLALVGS